METKNNKTKEQLNEEISELKSKIINLEKSKASEEKYRLIFEKMLIGFAYHKIVTNDAGNPIDYIFLEINSSFEKLTGLSRSNIIEKKATEVIPGIQYDPTDWIGKYGNVAQKGVELNFESFSEALNKWFSIYSYSPQKEYFVTFFEDITDRKRAENELAKLQVLHNETEKTAKIGGWTFDIETMEQTWTDGIFRILEIDLSMGTPKVPEGIAFIDPPYRQMAELAIQNSIENGEPYNQEWIVTTSKGNKRWVQSIANPHMENGKTIKISGSFQDITDRKQVEEALFKSEQKFKMLVTNIEEIIYLVDKNGIFTVSEGKGLEKLGLKSGQVVGQSVFDFYKDFPDILEGIHTALNGETNSMEVQIGPNYFTNWSTPHFNPEGEVIGLIGLAINITDRKKAENELKKHHEHLEELVKERTKDLETKNKELDNAMKVFVGRELAIRNLQERIRALEGK